MVCDMSDTQTPKKVEYEEVLKEWARRKYDRDQVESCVVRVKEGYFYSEWTQEDMSVEVVTTFHGIHATTETLESEEDFGEFLRALVATAADMAVRV